MVPLKVIPAPHTQGKHPAPRPAHAGGIQYFSAINYDCNSNNLKKSIRLQQNNYLHYNTNVYYNINVIYDLPR